MPKITRTYSQKEERILRLKERISTDSAKQMLCRLNCTRFSSATTSVRNDQSLKTCVCVHTGYGYGCVCACVCMCVCVCVCHYVMCVSVCRKQVGCVLHVQCVIKSHSPRHHEQDTSNLISTWGQWP